MRICLVSSYPPCKARLSEYAYHLVNELQKHQEIDRIHVIANRASSPEHVLINDKFTISYLWKPDNVLSMLSIPFKILALRPDVVHFNVHMAVFGRSRLANFFGLLLPFFCWLMGFRTIVTLHNIVDKIDIDKTGLENTLLNRVGAYMVVKLLTFCSVVTVLVRSYVNFMRKKYRCKNVFWIPHGTWKVRPINFHCSENPKTILYMGHSGPTKDLDLLFKAFSILSQKRDEVRLIVAGKAHPNYPDFLDQYRIRSNMRNVRFAGYIPEDQLSSFFERANVLVLPYHTCTGTSGMAHLAASYGVPIVATDLPELRELVEEGCAILLCSHTPRSLAEKITYVLDNPDVARRLKDRNFIFARTRTWDKVADSFLKYYKPTKREY